EAEAARAGDAEERIGIPEVAALEREQAIADGGRGDAGAPRPGDERARRRAADERRRQRGFLERVHDAGVREEAEEARREDELERTFAQSIGQTHHRQRQSTTKRAWLDVMATGCRISSCIQRSLCAPGAPPTVHDAGGSVTGAEPAGSVSERSR